MKQIPALLFLSLLIIGNASAVDQIVINEIMYNSDGTDVEFIELYNNSSSDVNLTGWYILDDDDSHAKCFLQGSLASGAYLVIVGDKTDFMAKYPGISNLNANEFDPDGNGWALGNGGDLVRLYNASGELQDIVNYQDGGDWPGKPDGNGPSLELLHPSLDNDLPSSWDPSNQDGGTPGAKNSVYTENVAPVCKDGERDIDLPTSSSAVTVTVIAYDNEDLSSVTLYVNSGSGYIGQAMKDDGSNGDQTAGDSVFTAIIQPKKSETLVRYYAKAKDKIGQSDLWPNNAPDEYHAYTVDYTPPVLKITEVMAINQTGIKDEADETDDWFELYNAGNETVNLGGMFVSDALNSPQAFELPSVNLNPDAYLIIWADNDKSQGNLHTNFALSSSGESVAIFETINHGNVLIHGWKYGLMSPDISMGFLDNGNAPEYLAVPTPGSSNDVTTFYSPVCINEFQSTSDFGGPDDWVEIYNRGDAVYDLSGCFLTDNRSNVDKWMFPIDPKSRLNPGEYLVIYEDVLGFSFASEGNDVIMLTAADTSTGLDFFDFGPQTADHSQGRSPDGSSRWVFFNEPSRGTANPIVSDVKNHLENIPRQYRLEQNYPNPFNPSTTISFSLPKSEYVSLKIMNLLGQEVETLVDKQLSAGRHQYIWNASHMHSGVYWIRLKVGTLSETKKMILMR